MGWYPCCCNPGPSSLPPNPPSSTPPNPPPIGPTSSCCASGLFVNDCGPCVFRAVLTGLASQDCANCDQINGVYYFLYESSELWYAVGPDICGFTSGPLFRWPLSFAFDGPSSVSADILAIPGDGGIVIHWQAHFTPSGAGGAISWQDVTHLTLSSVAGNSGQSRCDASGSQWDIQPW